LHIQEVAVSDDSVTRETVLDLDPEEAWHAVTDAEQLEQWLADEVEIDLVEGGDLRVRFDDGRERHGTVEQVAAPERVVFRWHPVPEIELETVVSIELEPAEDGTRVTVVETGFETLPVASTQACAAVNAWAWEARLEAAAGPVMIAA
jgi:uncharacterized protein YndB with AHSA1/START domain